MLADICGGIPATFPYEGEFVNPEVKELAKKWIAWAKRTKVYPIDGRSWHKKIEDPTGDETSE